MNSDQIVSKMNGYLHTASNVMVDWLNNLLTQVSDNWWDECVMYKLSFNQQDIAREKGYTQLKDFDLAALLRIADRSWYELRNVTYLPTSERTCIKDMMRVRNNWAHISANLPGKDAILADLCTLKDFFTQRKCDDSILNDIDRTIEEIKSSAVTLLSNIVEENNLNSEFSKIAEEAIEKTEDQITEKSLVYLIGQPDVKGIVMSVTDLGDTKKYQVFVNGSFNTYYSGQIALFEEKPSFNWLDTNTFRSYLTAYQINNPSNKNLYSLNSARIDFVPYQFRPALKLIHADEPRILIADSVGVGKTIEAGLIIKELQARHELESVLIICPKPLVSERKWELEMKRFDEDFIPLSGPELRQIIADTDRDGEWPIRFNKSIIPYSILDGQTFEGLPGKKGIKDLDPAPHFDLVIVDEAHHIRNGSMEQERAFEYKCVKFFCDHSDSVVMLTATPLQNSDDDLFTLLNVLRPDVVIDKSTFTIMSMPNAFISKCSQIIRKADKNWQPEANKELTNLLTTQWGENVISVNPTYSSIIKTLNQPSVTREERVKLISDVESLHSFNSMLNRTRRKDIQDFCVRKPYTLEVDFTPEQKILHDELLRFEQNALYQLHGSLQFVPFMMSTIKRQAASCIFGLAPHVRHIINRRFFQLEQEMEEPDEGIEVTPEDAETLKSLADNLLKLADNLPEEDPKYDSMLIKIAEKQKLDNNKIILFSTFRHTLSYLKNKLVKEGYRVEQVDGNVKDKTRQEFRRRFELPKNDPDALDILLFTEVGSEGLDYQFCNMMINYDLPWNPMRIEQRIGRIDRRGQTSEAISIYNVITSNTVDAEIYHRCLKRIGIFEKSIGECEKILGDIATKIEKIAVDSSLTPSERQDKLEQMADNEVRKIQEINRLEEEKKEFFGFDLTEYTTSQEIHKAENPWLNQNSLQNMVNQYLLEKLGQGDYFLGEGEVKQLRLSVIARATLKEDFQKLPGGRNAQKLAWEKYLKGNAPMHTVTFNSEAAEKNREAFFITAMHPLAKQAAIHFASYQPSYIRFQYASDNLPKGTYRFSVYAWNYKGFNPHFKLVTVCEDDVVASELPEILQESQTAASPINMQPSDWDFLEQKQIKLWKQEKEEAIKESENIARFKEETLTNNYKNRKRSFEQKIQDNTNPSILRMYQSQLESASEVYELKTREIDKTCAQTDILTTLIANGILEVA